MGSREKRLRAARKRKRQIATIFDALRHDRVSLGKLLETTPECLGNVTIYDVMRHANHLGPEGIKKCLQQAEVWPEDKMRDIPQDAKLRVIHHLPPRVRKYHAHT